MYTAKQRDMLIRIRCETLNPEPDSVQILEVYLGFHDFVDDIQSNDREWMVATPVINNLLEHLSPEANSDSQRNAAQILSQAAQAHRLPLSQGFASQQYLSRVFELAFSPNVSVEVLITASWCREYQLHSSRILLHSATPHPAFLDTVNTRLGS